MLEKKFNFNGGENILKSICWILSYLSWLLLSVNNLASLKWLYNDYNIWNIRVFAGSNNNNQGSNNNNQGSNNNNQGSNNNNQESGIYFPLQIDKIMIYIIFNLEIIIIFIGCIVFIIKTLIKPEDKLIDGMMNKFSQFHFFPLLCAFIMTVLGEAADFENMKDIANTGLAFSLFGLASMIFIYINTNCESDDWWAKYFLKNGTYSILIILFWYNFCYDIFLVRLLSKDYGVLYFYANSGMMGKGGIFDDADEGDDNDLWDLGDFRRVESVNEMGDITNWAKGCGMAFSLIFGISTIIFSYAFKDITICLMNILIYFGMAKYYFDLGTQTNDKNLNKNGDGAIDFIILICSVLLFIHFIIEIIKNMKNANANVNATPIANTSVNANVNNDKVNAEIQTLKNQILNIANVQNQTIMKVNANSEKINLISNSMNIASKT